MSEAYPYTLAQLRVFLDVAETLSFTASARRLHCTQPALSTSVRKLEAAIGAPLFHRERRHIQLTPAGHELLPVSRRLIAKANIVEQAVDRLAHRQGACVRMQIASAFFGMSSYEGLKAFRRAYPGVRLETRAFAGERSVQDILSGRVDVVYGPALARPDVEVRITGRAGVAAVLPPGHPFAVHRRLRWAMLRGEPLLLLSDGEGLPDILRRALEGQGDILSLRQTLARLESLVSLVRAGLGVGLISTPASAWLGSDNVRVVPLEDPVVMVPMAVSRLAGLGSAPLVDQLFDYLARVE